MRHATDRERANSGAFGGSTGLAVAVGVATDGNAPAFALERRSTVSGFPPPVGEEIEPFLVQMKSIVPGRLMDATSTHTPSSTRVPPLSTDSDSGFWIGTLGQRLKTPAAFCLYFCF